MTEKQKEFDLIFKKYGGYYDPAKNGSKEIQLACEMTKRNIYQTINSLKQDKYPLMPEIHVDFINSSILNASVSKYNDRYYFGINIGTLFLIADMFNKMF